MPEQLPYNLIPTDPDLSQTNTETRESEHLLRLEALSEKLQLKVQWESQVKTLNETGVIDILLDCQDIGVIGVDPHDSTKIKEYPISTYEEILSKITPEQLKVLETKQEQGFTKMLLVPIGAHLETLIDRYKQLLIKKHQEGKLLATDGSSLELKKDDNDSTKFDPVYVWDDIKNADTDGRLIYYPEQFDKDNHQGFVKSELISGKANNHQHQLRLDKLKSTNGWQILFIEDNPDLPAQNQGKTLNERKQLEANQTPIDYLNQLQTDPQYTHEQGLTLESWLIYAITQLQETNQQIDDWRSKGKACWLTGSYLAGKVLRYYWSRDNRRADLYGDFPDFSYGDCGSRPVVMLPQTN